MEHLVAWIFRILLFYTGAVPFLCWGWLTREKRPGIPWWLTALLVAAVWVLKAGGSPVFAAFLVSCAIAFAVGHFLWYRLARPERLVDVLPWQCLLISWYGQAPHLSLFRVDVENFLFWPAVVGGISVITMLAALGLSRPFFGGTLPRLPYFLGALLPLLLNPFHPYRWLAYGLGVATGWNLPYEEASNREEYRPLLRMIGFTFLFWFLSQGAWATWMERAFPFGPDYSTLLISDLALSTFYARHLHSISAVVLFSSTKTVRIPRGLQFRAAWVTVLLLCWAGGMLVAGAHFPLFLLVAAGSWAIGFVIAKSTKVPLDPTDAPFSPRVRLSYREYDRWAHRMVLVSTNMQHFLYSAFVALPEKMSLLHETVGASLHVWAIGWCTALLLPMDVVLGVTLFSADFPTSLSRIPADQRLGFGFVSAMMLGHLGGWAAGLFYRCLRSKY